MPATKQTKNTKQETLAKPLKRRSKDELVKLILDLANDFDEVRERLESQLEVELPTTELVAEAQRAIDRATYVPRGEINRNFRIDYTAYERVGWCFTQLVNSGETRAAMKLAEELLTRGSYQVEMSDEGLMSDEITEQLEIVFDAVADADFPEFEKLAWHSRMDRADRVGFLWTELLKRLTRREESKRHDRLKGSSARNRVVTGKKKRK